MHTDLELQRQVAERLRELPTELPLPYGWLEFRRRAQIRSGAGADIGADASRGAHGDSCAVGANTRADLGRRGVREGAGLAYVAAAAAVLVVVGTAALWSRTHRTRALAHSTPAAQSVPTDTDARTRNAERWLASLPPEPVIVRFGTRVAVTSLEDQIAQVDDLLTVGNFAAAQPARLAALRHERGRLINSLAQVRYAEALAANAP